MVKTSNILSLVSCLSCLFVCTLYCGGLGKHCNQLLFKSFKLLPPAHRSTSSDQPFTREDSLLFLNIPYHTIPYHTIPYHTITSHCVYSSAYLDIFPLKKSSVFNIFFLTHSSMRFSDISIIIILLSEQD